MFFCLAFELKRENAIFEPSGDQTGSPQPMDKGSENAPPHPGIGNSRSPLPSALTTQSAKRWSGAGRAWKRISFPLGDQLPVFSSLRTMPVGVIGVSPLPFSLIT